MNTIFEQMIQQQQQNENIAVTENGALGYRSTGKALLDLNFSVPQMRSMSPDQIWEKWVPAYTEDMELALRWLFFLRDVRGGLGERETFRTIMKRMVDGQPAVMRKLIGTENILTQYTGEIIPFYGRWDDLLEMSDTCLSRQVYSAIKKQLNQDLERMHNYQPVSLLAKWLPSLTTSKKSMKQASKLCKKIGMLETPYRKAVSALRQYIDVTEVKMSHRQWDQIDYSKVPSKAAMRYAKAFTKHDAERYAEFLSAVERGEAKINAGTLFPHEIVHRMRDIRQNQYTRMAVGEEVRSLEAQWKALPGLKSDNGKTIVVRDGSGSMSQTVGGKNSKISAFDVGDALSIYFAERLTGPFRDKIITFSERPKFIDLAGTNGLQEKMIQLARYTEVANTNIEAVFDLLLQTAVNNHLSQEDLPANILIISDMEFDGCAVCNSPNGYHGYGHPDDRLFQVISQRYEAAGYKLPRLVFWQVNSHTNAIPMVENELGVCLVSGFSINICDMVMSAETDPYQCLVKKLRDPRYDPISLALGYMTNDDVRNRT